ncbi:efflux RND transporter permease subunit [Halopseudomonas pachastrellae]|nr:efflux RND transporter permease subunit [Halopseudomonas pachastrellae]
MSGWVYVDVRGRDLASTVRELQQRVAERVQLDAGMTVSYSGQFEFLERANARLAWVVPATLLIIFVLLYLTFSRFGEALLIMAPCPLPCRAASGCSTGSASTCRWPPAWASSPWPASRPSSG